MPIGCRGERHYIDLIFIKNQVNMAFESLLVPNR